MIFQGSPRSEDNCPDQRSKTSLLADYLIDYAPKTVEIDYCDLSVRADTSIVQPCKGCVSTGNGFHCHYPCNCYVADSETHPDFMHDEDIYGRLERSDAFMVLSPVHWYYTTTQVKAMFDRLVCANLTITTEQAKQIGVGKSAKKSRALEKSGEFNHLLKNHYEGKYAAFFVHGDNGGKDYKGYVKRPDDKYYPSFPKAYTDYMDSANSEGWVNNPREMIMGLVWQCRYSGIHVPEDLIVGYHATSGLSNSEGMDLAVSNLDDFYQRGLDLLLSLIDYVTNN